MRPLRPSAMGLRLPIPRDQVAAFCETYGIRKFSPFGSVTRDDFGPDSDVDVLAEFQPGARFTLIDLMAMQRELTAIVGRRAEIFEFRSLRLWMPEEVAGSMEPFHESPD